MGYKPGVTALPQTLKDRIPGEYLQDASFSETVAAAGVLPPVVSREQKDLLRKRAEDQFKRGRSPNGVREQPRDYRGRFREVLARLKITLGESDLNEEVAKVTQAQQQEYQGNLAKAADAATDVVEMVDRLKTGALNPKQLENIKETTRQLGKTIAFLPLPQGNQNLKLRFSDLPYATQQLVENMKQRILKKLTPDKAAKLLTVLNDFIAGGLELSSDDIQSALAQLLTYLID